MGSLFITDHFADIMQETPKSDNLHLGPNFSCNRQADFGFLNGMNSQILAIRSPEFIAANELENIDRQFENAASFGNFLTFFQENSLHLFLNSLDHFLNPR